MKINIKLIGFLFLISIGPLGFEFGPVRADANRVHAASTESTAHRTSHLPAADTRTLKASSTSDPLAHALQLLNLSTASMVRPRYQQEGYHMIGHLPLVDHVAQSPVVLHDWADHFATRVTLSGEKGTYPVLQTLIKELAGSDAYGSEIPLSPETMPDILQAYRSMCRLFGGTVDARASAAIKAAAFSPRFSRQLGHLMLAITDAAITVQQALGMLTTDDFRFLLSRPERFFFPHDKQFNFLTGGTHVQFKVTEIMRKVDGRSMFEASLAVSQAIDRFVMAVKRLQQDDVPLIKHYKAGQPVVTMPTPIGPVVVLGPEDDHIDTNGALVVDLGGSDTYTGGIAAGHSVPGRVAVAIDLAGNDRYDAHASALVQGTGVLSIGMLIDVAGDDVYQAGDMAQGAGIYGVGVLADLAGSDRYQMGLMGQGFGVFGLGLLIDHRGDDLYQITGMGQGAGSSMGMGALCDLEGDDRYEVRLDVGAGTLIPDEWSHAQGAGLSIRSQPWTRHPSIYGGIGLLNDGGGDDRYVASNGNAMGSSYFMSIGMLVDHAGNDTYHAAGGYGMAFAVHLSNAVLIDKRGDDHYHANLNSGAVASDRSVAVLADYVGNDVYGPTPEDVHRMLTVEVAGYKARTENEQVQLIGKHLAQASYGSALKPMGLAMLFDAAGNDRYVARAGGRGGSLGGVLPPAAADEWNHAMLLDLGGQDEYTPPDCTQNRVTLKFKHAVCYDTEYSGAPLLGKKDAIGETSVGSQPNAAIEQWLAPLLAEYEDTLSNADLWTRFNAVGALVQLGPGVLPDVIQTLRVSTDDQLNRDLEEVVTHFILARQMNGDYRKQFVTLLSATEPQVQRYAARMLGWWRVKKEAQALQRARLEVHETVRPDVVWALSQLQSPEVAKDLLAAAEAHESLDNRRFAIAGLADQRFLTSLVSPAIADRTRKTLLTALTDPDPVIRMHAATGLERYATDESILQALKQALSDSNVYVRRAAARSVILSGDAGGIPVLIDSLQFRSIDTYKNYDHELAKDIAFFLGVDFEEDRRYIPQTWRTWWESNRHRVNLSKNLGIMREIQRAFSLADETSGIDIFRGLLKVNPNNIVILKRFDRFCYEWITFRLMTLPVVDQTVLNRCLTLQTIRVELNPQQADKHATLAYYYGRLNRFEDALTSIQRAIALDPDNTDYRQRQQAYLKMSEAR